MPRVPVSRRFFLKSAGVATASFGVVPSFLLRTAYAQNPAASKNRPILIAIFQRGAADGISMVVPFGDPHYASLRPQIALPSPLRGGGETTLDLDGFFGLHPALSSLKPIYDAGYLAMVQAVGSPDNTRSHFDAQDYMESGAPGNKSVSDGWINRYMQTDPRPKGSAPFRAIAMSTNMPRSLLGPAPALAMTKIQDFDVRGNQGRAAGNSNSEIYSAFESMWHNETFDAMKMLKDANPTRFQPENGAIYPNQPFSQSLMQIAQIIKADVGLEVAFADLSGWDTHANQGSVAGQLSNRLREFGDAIAALYRDLGDRMQNVVIVTMTEFGRSIKQNGSGGTDHGHASALFMAGGPVKGGKVYGKWPGLGPNQLFEGRDLALTTDFRDVFAEILTKHMHTTDVARVFPGYTPHQSLGIL
jgi:uncharacterized protein (DUF1501 family)